MIIHEMASDQLERCIKTFKFRPDPSFTGVAAHAVPVPTPFPGGERAEGRSLSMRAAVELQLSFQFKFEKGTSCTNSALLTIIIYDSSDYDTCVGL